MTILNKTSFAGVADTVKSSSTFPRLNLTAVKLS